MDYRGLSMRLASQEFIASVTIPHAHPCPMYWDLCSRLQPFWTTWYSLMILWFLLLMPLYPLVPLPKVALCPFALPFFYTCITFKTQLNVTSSGKTSFFHPINTVFLCLLDSSLTFTINRQALSFILHLPQSITHKHCQLFF